MINVKDKYAFIHIPRTGGTSLLSLLGMDPRESRKNRDRWRRDHLLRIQNINGVRTDTSHWTYSEIKEYMDTVKGIDIDKYFSFTIVRNPYDRALSVYSFYKDQNPSDTITLDEFYDPERVMKLRKDPIEGRHLLQQVDFLDPNIDKVIDFDSKEVGFRQIAPELGLGFSILPHKRNSIHSTPLNETSHRLIQTLYEKDLEMYNSV